MMEDEVVREVRAAREAFAATFDFDIGAMVRALHELGVASGRQLIRLDPRPPRELVGTSIASGSGPRTPPHGQASDQ